MITNKYGYIVRSTFKGYDGDDGDVENLLFIFDLIKNYYLTEAKYFNFISLIYYSLVSFTTEITIIRKLHLDSRR